MLQVFLLIQNEKLRNDYVYQSWLARCCKCQLKLFVLIGFRFKSFFLFICNFFRLHMLAQIVFEDRLILLYCIIFKLYHHKMETVGTWHKFVLYNSKYCFFG